MWFKFFGLVPEVGSTIAKRHDRNELLIRFKPVIQAKIVATEQVKQLRNSCRRWRDEHKRKRCVSNKSTGEAYDIIPKANDGVATASPDWPFPRGDVWILHHRGTEIDDGVHAVGPPYEAGISHWVNGAPINSADVVISYGAHFTHDIGHEEPGEFGHIVGPDLKLVKW